MTSSIRIKDTVARAFIAELFQRLGVPQDDAWIAADVLVRADLRGVESHGVNNLWQYVNPLREGTLNPTPHIRTVRESPVLALVDGDGGMGLVVGVRAMRTCIAKARDYGLAAVTVRRSRHYGMVAMSKAALATTKGDKIPLGWALDDDGQPTDDPQTAIDARRFLPLGGTRELGSHKGYGLAVVVDILTGVLAGAMYGNLAQRNPPADETLRVGSSHFFAALRVDVLQPVDEFKAAMDDMLRALKDSPTADGHDRVYTHGEIEFETEQERLKHGIPYHPIFVDYLRELASEFGVPFEI